VKTLHPSVHGGILAIRSNAEHMAAIKQHDISTIDVVGGSGRLHL
jgi:phosphoribosylaminoimidazolecarboxamide formyltransferase/IMP cyclohydrolase